MQHYGHPATNTVISPPMQPGQMFFRYRIDRRLGRGGMGEVYEAFDTRLRRAVALKILTTEGNASYTELRQLLVEARALAALHHKNIVTVYDVSDHANIPHLTMELLTGRSLKHHAKSGEGSQSDRLRWLVEIADALATVHRSGLIHRDVKPGNVMVTHDGRAVLFDFGIARQVNPHGNTLDGQSMRAGMVIGTPRYMAPELVSGTRASAASDQYAWGIIAAQLLTGEVPTPDDDVARMLAGAGIPSPIAAVVLRAVDPCAELRFPQMDELVATLEPLTHTAPEAATGRARRSLAVPIVVVAALSTAVGAVGGAIWQRHTTATRHDARSAPAVALPTVSASTPTSSTPSATSTHMTSTWSAQSSTPLVPLDTSTATTQDAPTARPSAEPSGIVQHLAPVTSSRECAVDEDCGCGVSKATGACAVGPLTRIDTSRRCPDYCEGFEGNMYTTCRAGRCVKSQRFSP